MDRSIQFKLTSYSYVAQSGKMVRTETSNTVFGYRNSISQQEFFAAFNAGLKADFVITMFAPDYNGEKVCKLEENGAWIDYDIYRTYEKNNERIELFVTKRNTSAPYIVTMFTDGKQIKLHGVYLTGTNGENNATYGGTATDTVTLVIPRDVVAYNALQAVTFYKPKAYARLDSTNKAKAFTIDSNCFFCLGDIDVSGSYTYQSVNSTYDDVYRVQSVNNVNKGSVDTEYIEVKGK